MNRLLSFILAILFMASSCRKYEIVEQNAPHKPCILQFELPDSVGKWRIDTFPLPKNDRYNKDIFFVNENVGFLLKDYHTLFKTSDGGKTWAQINSFSNYESAEEVYFINENIGFVSVFGRPNARLLTTIDGGRTWENRIFPMNGTVQNIHSPPKEATHRYHQLQLDRRGGALAVGESSANVIGSRSLRHPRA